MKIPTNHKDKKASVIISADGIEDTVLNGLEVFYSIEDNMMILELRSPESPSIAQKLKIHVKIENK